MTITLSPERFDEGVGVFDVDCVLVDENGAQFTIAEFSGYAEIDDETGQEHERIAVHLQLETGLDLRVAFEDFEHDVYNGALNPVSPDWFIEEIKSWRGEVGADAAAEQQRKAKQEREARGNLLGEIKQRLIPGIRPVEHYTDTELFAKISGSPLVVAEELLTSYESDLARMAGSTPKQMQKISGIGETRSEKIIAAFELGKRLARFHATREKITSPSDVADLMMSKLRYLQKEVVVVLALDTKGGVTSTGKAGDLAGDLKWGKMLGESQVFEGTLNASVFHPREIFRFAIEESANSIVLVHNHPSGDPQPSQEDIRATKQLIEAGNQIGIKVLDHIIIGDGIFVSLKEENLI